MVLNGKVEISMSCFSLAGAGVPGVSFRHFCVCYNFKVSIDKKTFNFTNMSDCTLK